MGLSKEFKKPQFLRELTVSYHQLWQNTFPWGGGHTHTTDPTKRGWRMKAVSSKLTVIGRTGIPGCMSVLLLSEGFDVAIYDEEKPEDIFRALKDGQRLQADEYKQVGNYSGWALALLQEIEGLNQEFEELEEKLQESGKRMSAAIDKI